MTSYPWYLAPAPAPHLPCETQYSMEHSRNPCKLAVADPDDPSLCHYCGDSLAVYPHVPKRRRPYQTKK